MAYFVYELVSQAKKRVYVGIAEDLAAELGRLRRSPPEELAGWPHADTRKPRIVEVLGTMVEACAFGRRYADRAARPGWKTSFSSQAESDLCSAKKRERK